MKKIDQQVGALPQLFGEPRWDGQRHYYRMSDNVKGAIRMVSE